MEANLATKYGLCPRNGLQQMQLWIVFANEATAPLLSPSKLYID
jgi:hypothetical protein